MLRTIFYASEKPIYKIPAGAIEVALRSLYVRQELSRLTSKSLLKLAWTNVCFKCKENGHVDALAIGASLAVNMATFG